MKKSALNKIMSTGDVIVVAFGAMIGWGWVVSSGEWIQKAGAVGTALGFILGGIMIYFVGLAYAELTAAIPQSGGGHVFSYRALGKCGSFICTWAMILSYVGVVCFEACSLPTVLSYVFPGFLKGYLYTIYGFDVYASWLFVAIVFAILITYVNIKGVKVAAKLQTILTLVIAGVGILLVAASAVTGSADNISNQLIIGEDAESVLGSIMAVAVLAPFFLFGFDVIPQAAEEINVSPKKIGKLLVLSIILAVSFYAFVVLAIGFVMSPKEILVSSQGTGLVAADAMAKAFSSPLMAQVLIIGGVCGILTSWNSFLIGGSRAIYAMANSNMIPAVFGKIHSKYKTPVNALILIGILSVIAPFLGRGMLLWISNASSLACCISYCIVSVSFIVLRVKEPNLERPFKVRWYSLIGVMAVLLSGGMAILYLIPGTSCSLSMPEWWIVLTWIVLGVILAIWYKVNNRKKKKYKV